MLAPLPVREVMPPDEPRFAEVAREMRSGGHWIAPQLAGRVYPDKPPALFWAINLPSIFTGGVTATTSRIPSAIAALMVLFLTARLGRRLFASTATGFGAAVVLLTTSEFFQKAQWASTDMLLTAFCLAAAVCWREALFSRASSRSELPEDSGALPAGNEVPDGVAVEEPSRNESAEPLVAGRAPAPKSAVGASSSGKDVRSRKLLLGWLAAAGATLTKGPIGVLWPLAWVLAEGVARRRLRETRALTRPVGLLLFALIVGGWLVAAEIVSGGGFLREVLFHQSLERYVSAWNNIQPWYFYLYHLPLDLAPWSLFLPAAVLLVWSGRRSSIEESERAARVCCALYVVLAVAFFSISPGKRGVYLLPAFPAAAILINRAFIRAGESGEPRAAWREVPLAFLALLGVAVALAIPALDQAADAASATVASSGVSRAASHLHHLSERYGWTAVGASVVAGIALAASCAAALLRSRFRNAEKAFGAFTVGLLVAFFAAGTVAGATASRHQAAAAFGHSVAAHVPEGKPIAIERGKFELILFYSGRGGVQFEKDDELFDELRSKRAEYALLEQPTFERLAPTLLGSMQPLFAGKISDTSYVLLGPASTGPGS